MRAIRSHGGVGFFWETSHMAYANGELVAKYTAANLGKAPDAATTLALNAMETQTQNGGLSDDAALTNALKLVNSTTAVAIETYQFFVGHAPSAAGLSYLVNSSANANDLNDAYFAKFSAENRFINFSINLATGSGEGAAAFAAAYSSVSYADTVATAYDKIIGNAVATAAGVDVAASVAFFSRAENITYLTNFVKANTGLTTTTEIDLAVKAALIGEILNAATASGLGGYATATKAMIVDLSDGTLSTDNAAGVDLFTAYPAAPVGGQTFTLTTGVDTLNGTSGNDTFTGTGKALTSLDGIVGGAGVDTLVITDPDSVLGTTLASGISISGVEKATFTTAGSLGSTGTAGTPATPAQSEIDTIAFAGTAAADTYDVSYGGVTVTTAATAGATAAEAAGLVRDAINALAGSTIASVVGGQVVVTGPTGVDIPTIDVIGNGAGTAVVTEQQTASTGSAGTPAVAVAQFDLSAAAGLTDFTGTAAGTVNVKVANTTNATITNGAAGAVTVTGGKAVTITNGLGAVTVDGASGLTSVSVSGGTTVTVDDNGTSGSAGTLTSVTLNKLGGTANLTGDALTSITLSGANTAARTVNVINGEEHTLTVNAAGTGYASNGTTVNTITIADTEATTIAFNTTAKSNVALANGGNVETVTAAGAGALVLALNAVNNTELTSFDGSAATGAITLTGLSADITSIKTGAGNDTVTVDAALAAGTTISLGAGNDKLLVATGGGSIAGTVGSDVTAVDGGDGTDTLALQFVGSANIGSFKNFEVFDTIGMTAKTLDLDILATNNTVTGISGSGAFNGDGNVELTNLGAGVGYSQNGAFDADGSDRLILTQKTAGALSITLNADSTSTSAQNDTGLVVTASNATSLNAVFDVNSGFAQTAGTKNDATLDLTGSKATSLSVVSGGSEATNHLDYHGADTGAAGTDYLTSVTITGSQALVFTYDADDATSITSVDASGLTGGLTLSLSALKAAADFSSIVKLGSGDDTLTAANNAAIQGIELGSAENATSRTGFDVITLTGGIQAADDAGDTTTYAIKDGLLTFLGAGPTTLTDAITTASSHVGVNGVVAFEYAGNSYIFAEGGNNASTADDVVIKLVGTTGLHGLDTVAANTLYVY